MELWTLLWIMTVPGGERHVMMGFPTNRAECHSFVVGHGNGWRDSNICVHSPVWVIDHKHWKLVGNRLMTRDDGRLWPTEREVATTRRTLWRGRYPRARAD